MKNCWVKLETRSLIFARVNRGSHQKSRAQGQDAPEEHWCGVRPHAWVFVELSPTWRIVNMVGATWDMMIDMKMPAQQTDSLKTEEKTGGNPIENNIVFEVVACTQYPYLHVCRLVIMFFDFYWGTVGQTTLEIENEVITSSIAQTSQTCLYTVSCTIKPSPTLPQKAIPFFARRQRNKVCAILLLTDGQDADWLVGDNGAVDL